MTVEPQETNGKPGLLPPIPDDCYTSGSVALDPLAEAATEGDDK